MFSKKRNLSALAFFDFCRECDAQKAIKDGYEKLKLQDNKGAEIKFEMALVLSPNNLTAKEGLRIARERLR